MAHVRLSFTVPKPAERCVTEFVGTEGILRVETFGGIKLARRQDGAWQDVPYDATLNAFDYEVKAFLDAIETGGAVPVTVEDGREALRVVHAFYENAVRQSPW